MKIGIKLKTLRASKQYSQEYVAYRLDISQGNYCKLESDHHFPNQIILDKLATLYNINLREFLQVEGESSNGEFETHISKNVLKTITTNKEWEDHQKALIDLIHTKDKLISILEKKLQELVLKV